MKGKATKDIIFLKVGQGLMRVPRERFNNPYEVQKPASPYQPDPSNKKEKTSRSKTPRS